MDNVDADLRTDSPPVPVTILTGFLGAGKTTLLNRILNGGHGLRVAVLVNDFGSINVDADLIVSVESNVVSLANGCVCCTIRDDLIETVTEVLGRPEKPEYILLEASGVAEPSGIAATFLNPSFRDSVRLDSIICVLDAEQVFAAPELMQLKLWQIGFADLLILNKVDLVGPEAIDRIRAWLDRHLHRYRLIEARHGDVPLEVLLAVGRFDPAQLNGGPGCPEASDDDHEHGRHFSAWSFETDRPLSLEKLREAASRLPVSVYRAKGVIYSSDAPERRAVLQVVGKRVDISLEGAWGERKPRSRIVAIGAAGGLDGQTLRERFEATAGPQGSRIQR